MEPPRVTNLAIPDFLEHVSQCKPVVISDAMRDWNGLQAWTPEYLRRRFGTSTVQVYDDLFQLVNICYLSDYLEQHFQKAHTRSSVPYVRWYTKLKDVDFVWADDEFRSIREQWTSPYFMPDSSYLLPFCMPPQTISPTDSAFPAKGLFISGRGARTNLHRDPLASDAVLFQIYGDKKWTMYAPEQLSLLSAADGTCVDIDAPNPTRYPRFAQARADFEFVLHPGEAVYVPRGWLHHVLCLSDSISLTWNFVHRTTLGSFLSFLESNPTGQDLEVLQFFFSDCVQKKNAAPAEIARFLSTQNL